MNQVLQGDCLEVIKTLEDNSIDLTVTSPPYNIGKMHSNKLQFGTYKNNDLPEEDYQRWQIDVLNELYRITTDEGSLFYNHKVRIKNGKAIHPIEFIIKSNWLLKQEIVWDMGKSANSDKIRFFPYSERIYWLVKNPKTKLSNINNLSDVWRVVPTANRKTSGHIAVMPDQIVQNIIDAVKSNVILDPFAGSGTTLKMAQKNNRNYIGIEISQEYIDIINKRLETI